MRIGTDTSFWAENVDYTKMVANGAEFTILRAGQGSWIDNYFQKNYDASEGMLPRSTYWFFDQRYKPSRQAELLAAVLKDNPLEGYIWADYERDYEGASYAKWEDFHTFLREIERLIPDMVGRIGVYTRYYYFSEKVPSDKWYLFEKYPFWEARYEAEAPFDKPFKCLLWQYSEKGDGLAYGLDPYVKKFIDLNYFRGTDEEWKIFTGNSIVIPPDPIDPPVEPVDPGEYKGTVISPTGINIRTSPEVLSDNKVGAMWKGSVLVGSDLVKKENGNEWLLLKDAYVAVKYNGQTLLELEDVVEEPEPPIEPPAVGREDWKPDPVSELHFTRHTGYAKVPIYSSPNGRIIEFMAEQSAILLGNKVVDNFMRVTWYNNDYKEDGWGWVDYTAKDMLPIVDIPQTTLNRLIPPRKQDPVLLRTVTVPDDGQYVYFEHAKTKDYTTTQPDTAVLWQDNQQHSGWIETTEDLQWLAFELLMVAAPGYRIDYYVSAWLYTYADNRFFTDLQDKDGHRDYVSGQNPNASPFKIKYSIITRGNAFIVDEKITNNSFILGGLDITNPMPKAEDIYGNPRYVFFATQQSPEILSNGKPKVTHQPGIKQLVIEGGVERMEKTGTPIPKISAIYTCPKDGYYRWANSGEKLSIVNLSRDL
jgi:GH25 family lysozyme M1 (1,4-beta-N-acetylmuramidase)